MVELEEFMSTARSGEYEADVTFAQMLPNMKKEACRVGADAIIIKESHDGDQVS